MTYLTLKIILFDAVLHLSLLPSFIDQILLIFLGSSHQVNSKTVPMQKWETNDHINDTRLNVHYAIMTPLSAPVLVVYWHLSNCQLCYHLISVPTWLCLQNNLMSRVYVATKSKRRMSDEIIGKGNSIDWGCIISLPGHVLNVPWILFICQFVFPICSLVYTSLTFTIFS